MDLMLLVTKSNKAGNNIIQFSNKHLNLATLPLPKNIEKECEFMDNAIQRIINTIKNLLLIN